MLLGTVDERFDTAHGEGYLEAISGGTPPGDLTEKVAHPGWLLRRAKNRILSRNVEMGPWMHVESNTQQLGLVHDGEAISTRGRVTDVFERGGHKFVTIDVVVYTSGVPALRVGHTAIYEPRRSSGALFNPSERRRVCYGPTMRPCMAPVTGEFAVMESTTTSSSASPGWSALVPAGQHGVTVATAGHEVVGDEPDRVAGPHQHFGSAAGRDLPDVRDDRG